MRRTVQFNFCDNQHVIGGTTLQHLQPPRGRSLFARRQRAQVASVNERIAALSAIRPYCNIGGAFSFTGHLATDAIATAMEFQQLPGIDAEAFQSTLEFWHRLRDYNYTARLTCAGGNQTLAEALVTFRLLSKYGRGR